MVWWGSPQSNNLGLKKESSSYQCIWWGKLWLESPWMIQVKERLFSSPSASSNVMCVPWSLIEEVVQMLLAPLVWISWNFLQLIMLHLTNFDCWVSSENWEFIDTCKSSLKLGSTEMRFYVMQSQCKLVMFYSKTLAMWSFNQIWVENKQMLTHVRW